MSYNSVQISTEIHQEARHLWVWTKGIEKTDGMHFPSDPVASPKSNLDLISLSNSNTYTEFKSKAVNFFKTLNCTLLRSLPSYSWAFFPTHKYELPLLNAHRQLQACKPGNLRLWQLLLMQKISAELFQGGKRMPSTLHMWFGRTNDGY